MTGWVCLAVWITTASAQAVLILDTVRIALSPGPTGDPVPVLPFRYSNSTDYALTASLLCTVNDPGQSKAGQLVVMQSFRYGWTVGKPPRVTLTNSFSHRLAVQHWFDSITLIQADENIFRSRLEYAIRKGPSVAFDSELSTRLLNGYDYMPGDSNRTLHVLSSSFLTPFVWNMSLGLSFRIPGTGSVMAGITGLRLTCLRDTSVFGERQAGVFHGVERGSDHAAEYGLSCRFQADRTFWKILRWNCDMLVFKGYRKPADLNLRNLFEIRPVDFLVISLQTRLAYGEEISKRLRVENILSAGFSLKRQVP